VTLGAQPKKVAVLGVLLAVAAVAFYMNVLAGDSERPTPAPQRAPVLADPVNDHVNKPPQGAASHGNDRRAGRGAANTSAEIKFRQGSERPEDRPDPATIDPTLRLDLLAKVQNVEPEASMRNIFQYGAAPPPPAKALPVMPSVGQIPVGRSSAPPPPPPQIGPPPTPPPPMAPPITMKYYGYQISKVDGTKKAFLLDGDDIIIAGENESVKRGRYKVVAIGLTSITIEDTQFKSNQTVRIQEDPVV
jgi:hypothetical protein